MTVLKLAPGSERLQTGRPVRYQGAVHGKHHRTLQAIFADPAPANLRWRDIETLLAALGVRVEEAAGRAWRWC